MQRLRINKNHTRASKDLKDGKVDRVMNATQIGHINNSLAQLKDRFLIFCKELDERQLVTATESGKVDMLISRHQGEISGLEFPRAPKQQHTLITVHSWKPKRKETVPENKRLQAATCKPTNNSLGYLLLASNGRHSPLCLNQPIT